MRPTGPAQPPAAQEVSASQKSVPEQIVDAVHGVLGMHPGARTTRAKRVVLFLHALEDTLNKINGSDR